MGKGMWLSTAVTVMLLLLASHAAGLQTTTIWVSVTGSDDGDGTAINPYKTLNKAVNEAKLLSGNKVIKVGAGDYDWLHESSFTAPSAPFPISIPTQTHIVAADTSSTSTWPHIGGGVPSSSTEELLLVNATGASRSNVELHNVYFVGEDVTDQDGPSAIRFV